MGIPYLSSAILYNFSLYFHLFTDPSLALRMTRVSSRATALPSVISSDRRESRDLFQRHRTNIANLTIPIRENRQNHGRQAANLSSRPQNRQNYGRQAANYLFYPSEVHSRESPILYYGYIQRIE